MITKLGEPQQVFAHRWARCHLLGLSDEQADQVANSQIDVHELEDLLKAGCPPHLALKILS